MAGLSTVRACNAEDMLRDQFDDKQDVHTAAWLVTKSIYVHKTKVRLFTPFIAQERLVRF